MRGLSPWCNVSPNKAPKDVMRHSGGVDGLPDRDGPVVGEALDAATDIAGAAAAVADS